MRKFLLLAAAAATLGSFPAYAAPTAGDNIPITAAIAPECSLQDNLGSINLGSLPIDLAPGPSALELVGTTTGSIPEAWASCNTEANVELTSTNGGLVSAARAADPSNGTTGFTNQINYRAQLVNVGSTISFTTTGTAGEGTLATRDAFHSQAEIRVQVVAADNPGKRPLAAIDYEDVLVVTFTAI